MGRNDYKKLTVKECRFCDYLTCRKGHKCKHYKKHIKSIKQRGKKYAFRDNEGGLI